jgi:ferritin-like metal-binding protein YciE
METKTKRPTAGNAKSAVNSGVAKLFTDQLKNILWSERALERIVHKMARSAGSPNLISIIRDHDNLTERRIKRLEEVFESVGVRDRGKKCETMEGLIGECENILEEIKQGPVRDAGMIAAYQKILHYLISSYNALITFGSKLGKIQVGEILELTLAEDKQRNDLLSDAACNTINYDAAIDENKFLASHYQAKDRL